MPSCTPSNESRGSNKAFYSNVVCVASCTRDRSIVCIAILWFLAIGCTACNWWSMMNLNHTTFPYRCLNVICGKSQTWFVCTTNFAHFPLNCVILIKQFVSCQLIVIFHRCRCRAMSQHAIARMLMGRDSFLSSLDSSILYPRSIVRTCVWIHTAHVAMFCLAISKRIISAIQFN